VQSRSFRSVEGSCLNLRCIYMSLIVFFVYPKLSLLHACYKVHRPYKCTLHGQLCTDRPLVNALARGLYVYVPTDALGPKGIRWDVYKNLKGFHNLNATEFILDPIKSSRLHYLLLRRLLFMPWAMWHIGCVHAAFKPGLEVAVHAWSLPAWSSSSSRNAFFFVYHQLGFRHACSKVHRPCRCTLHGQLYSDTPLVNALACGPYVCMSQRMPLDLIFKSCSRRLSR